MDDGSRESLHRRVFRPAAPATSPGPRSRAMVSLLQHVHRRRADAAWYVPQALRVRLRLRTLQRVATRGYGHFGDEPATRLHAAGPHHDGRRVAGQGIEDAGARPRGPAPELR